MGASHRPNRIVVVRRLRRYSVCGRRIRQARHEHPSVRAYRRNRRAALVPGATLLLIVVFSAFVLVQPPAASWSASYGPVGMTRHSFSEFAEASR